MDLNQNDNGEGIEFLKQNEFICTFKKNYLITYVSPLFCMYFNRIQEELIDKNFLDFVFKKDRAAIDKHLSALTPDNPVFTIECRSRNQNGEPIWQKWTFWAFLKSPKEFKEFRAIGIDITALKKVEANLLYAKNQYQAVVEDQMELVCRYLPNCILTFVNQAYCNYYEKEPQQLIGNTFLHHMNTEDQKKLFEFIKAASPEYSVFKRIQFETRNDGESIWIEWQRRALFDDSGKLREIQSIGVNISELKRVEAALRSSEEALQKKNAELERKNSALIEVLEQIEHQKNQIKTDVVSNVDELLMPILEQLRTQESKFDPKYLKLIKRSLENLTSSFGRKITHASLKLTPKEIQISNMVKQGLTSKEIAGLLNISVHTVGQHRSSIRKKMNITNKERNLNTYLQSI